MNTTHRVGDRVGVDDTRYGGVWTVVSTKGTVNAVLEPEGGGRGLRVPYTLLTDPPVAGANGATVQAVPVPTYFSPGEFVRIASGKFAGLYVVIADRGGDKVNVAKPGGEGGRYVRAHRRGLTKVDPDIVEYHLRHLAEWQPSA